MKYLLVLAVIGIVWWLTSGRDRRVEKVRSRAAARPPEPVVMLACAHCGLNLPRTEAAFDAAGRPFCSDAHRIAGPR